MAYKKSSSPVTEGAQTRLASLSSIDPALDLGNGLTLAVYRSAIQGVQGRLETYNSLLSQADQAANDLRAGEKELRALSERMLAGVAAKFGTDSNEYEMAGGVRKSEIKQPARKPKSAA